MKQILLVCGFLTCTYINAQNSYIYTKEGEKITISTDSVYFTWRGGVHHSPQKKNGSFGNWKRMDIEEIEKLETVNNVTYETIRRNQDAPFGLYKTLIKGNGKRLIFCFRPYNSERNKLMTNYTILDADDNELISGMFKEHERDKQELMFKAIINHFPNCKTVLDNIAKYKDVEINSNLTNGYSREDAHPVGFMFQNRVITCD